MERFYTIEDISHIAGYSQAYSRNKIKITGEKTGEFQGIRFFRFGRRWLTTAGAISAAIPDAFANAFAFKHGREEKEEMETAAAPTRRRFAGRPRLNTSLKVGEK